MAAFMIVTDEQVRRNLRRQRVFRDRQNQLDAYNDIDIIHRYRLDRLTIISVIDMVQDRLERPTKRSGSLPASLQVSATLRFLASGSQQRVIGDTMGISHRRLGQGYYICNLFGFFSNRFLSIVSKWPGSTHDAFIWANCSIAQKFENGQMNGWILGDSGYPLRPWLLTPVGNPTSRGEDRYNGSHRRTRVVVEQAFGVLKSRFRCLHKTGGALEYTPAKCCKIVYVCCQLHNICIDKRIPVFEEPEEALVEAQNEVTYQGPVNDGKTTREQLIRQRFA
ncbi:putative nuclease HARBI1 [Saccostrea cucullata]|uniref:putative nuclease HARBI1 n=1 Tax=Saccostrea cuccullata TaxID=36930 RepID=UPI002ED6B3B0